MNKSMLRDSMETQRACEREYLRTWRLVYSHGILGHSRTVEDASSVKSCELQNQL